MSRSDRDKWDARYRSGAYAGRLYPNFLVADHVPTILAAQRARAEPHSEEPLRALDLACGAGRNAFYLARMGYAVDGVDISAEALERGRRRSRRRHLPISWMQHDLDLGLPRGLGTYDLIVIIRYLDLSMVEAAAERLHAGGYLICEAHLMTDQPVIGPHNPVFRAGPGELRAAAAALKPIEYWEGLTSDPDGRAVALARLVAWMPYETP